MRCKNCGTDIPNDSKYCLNCGKSIGTASIKTHAKSKRQFQLSNPYLYAALPLVLFLIWAFMPREPSTDYSQLRLELELKGQSRYPNQQIFRHHLSLIVENIGDDPISEIPVQIRVHVDPPRSTQVVSDFLGRQLTIMKSGQSLPLIIILSDEVQSGQKRRYSIDGIVTTIHSGEGTYEILVESTGEILTALTAKIESQDKNEDPNEPIA